MSWDIGGRMKIDKFTAGVLVWLLCVVILGICAFGKQTKRVNVYDVEDARAVAANAITHMSGSISTGAPPFFVDGTTTMPDAGAWGRIRWEDKPWTYQEEMRVDADGSVTIHRGCKSMQRLPSGRIELRGCAGVQLAILQSKGMGYLFQSEQP